MNIQLREIIIRDLVEAYSDDGDGGVSGYGGRLDIRPPYQREFVYKDKQRDAVIETIQQRFPLNVMYWSDSGDGKFEMIDGQQRTISICQYVKGGFSIGGLAFHNLQNDQKEAILNYKLMVYVCSGTDSEKLKWFETINIAGAVLTEQELRNAVYHGTWVSSAKRYFSRPGCPAREVGGKYLNGSAIRQDYLETAIKWINGGDVKGYMSMHQLDSNAEPLWDHFRSVIEWTKSTFISYDKHMRGVDWGHLHNRFKDARLNASTLDKKVKKLMQDDDVTNKSGIYAYLLGRDERYLNIRAFTQAMKTEAFGRQKRICRRCNKKFVIEDMDADHIDPWSKGGKTNADNCQMLCRPCNRRKGAK